MERVKENKVSIILCHDDKYKKQYVSDFIEKDGYKPLDISPTFDNYKKLGPFTVKNKKKVIDILMRDDAVGSFDKAYILGQLDVLGASFYLDRVPMALAQLQKQKLSLFLNVFNGRKKRIILDDNDGKLMASYIDVVKYLAQSKEFEGGSVILFTTASIVDVLLELGCDLSSYKLYHLLYQNLNELDCNNYKALVSVEGIRKNAEKGLAEVDAVLLFGKVCNGDVLENVYGGPPLRIIGDIEYIDNTYKKAITPCFNQKNSWFTFYLDSSDYVHVNPPKILMIK